MTALRPDVVLLLADLENVDATFSGREHPRHVGLDKDRPGDPFDTADAAAVLTVTRAEIAAVISLHTADIEMMRDETAPMRNKVAEIARRQLRRQLDPVMRAELTEWLRDHGGDAA